MIAPKSLQISVPIKKDEKIEISKVKDQLKLIKQRQEEEALKMLMGNAFGIKDFSPISEKLNQTKSDS